MVVLLPPFSFIPHYCQLFEAFLCILVPFRQITYHMAKEDTRYVKIADFKFMHITNY